MQFIHMYVHNNNMLVVLCREKGQDNYILSSMLIKNISQKNKITSVIKSEGPWNKPSDT